MLKMPSALTENRHVFGNISKTFAHVLPQLKDLTLWNFSKGLLKDVHHPSQMHKYKET